MCYKLDAKTYERIGASKQVIDWIENGVTPPFTSEPHACEYTNRIKIQHSKFVTEQVKQLLSIGAVRKVDKKLYCILALQCVPKKNKKLRLVLNC